MSPLVRRWFWPVWQTVAVAAFGVMLLVTAGGYAEGAIDPILDDITLDQANVTRTADTVCWKWDAQKHRKAKLSDIDVILERVDGRKSFPEILDAGIPWGLNVPHEPGGVHHDQCIAVPEDLKRSGQPFTVRFRILFKGFVPLTLVPVAFPEVIVPGTIPAP